MIRFFRPLPKHADGTLDIRQIFGPSTELRTQKQIDWYTEALWRARVRMREQLQAKALGKPSLF